MNRMSAKLAATAVFAIGLVALSAAAQAPAPWPQPNPETLQQGAFKDMVLYGRKLFNETYSVIGPEVADRNMRYSGNNLSCQSCHLDSGTQRFGLPVVGVYGAFPTYMAREDEVRTLEERIQGCMERSMNGRELPLGGKEMKAFLAYIQFVSTDIPFGNVGGLISTPVINHPEVAILGLGKVVKRPVYDAAGNIKRADLIYLSLSCDHRVVDGAVGAAFAKVVIRELQKPAGMLLSQ